MVRCPLQVFRLEAKRVANRNDELSAPQGFGVAERCCQRSGGQLGAQEGQIGVEIVSEHLGLSFAAFSEREAHAPGSPDNVAVGDDEAISCDNHARAHAAMPSILVGTLDANNGRTHPVGHCGDDPRTSSGTSSCGGLIGSSSRIRWATLGTEEPSKTDHAEARCMGDCVSATDRVELVEQRANVELGRVDGNAEPPRDRLI